MLNKFLIVISMCGSLMGCMSYSDQENMAAFINGVNGSMTRYNQARSNTTTTYTRPRAVYATSGDDSCARRMAQPGEGTAIC